MSETYQTIKPIPFKMGPQVTRSLRTQTTAESHLRQRFGSGRGRLPSRESGSSPGLSVALRAVLKYARSSPAGRRRQTARATPSHLQHCAVRVSYSSNRVAGGRRAWPVHCEGECVAGTGEGGLRRGNDSRRYRFRTSELAGWRRPAVVDLRRLTRDVMSRLESDLHTSLDWVAVAHFNTGLC